MNISSLPPRLRLRALKGMLGLTNEQISARTKGLDPWVVGAAINSPGASDEVERVLTDLASKYFEQIGDEQSDDE